MNETVKKPMQTATRKQTVGVCRARTGKKVVVTSEMKSQLRERGENVDAQPIPRVAVVAT
jgi:hypothetical protein